MILNGKAKEDFKEWAYYSYVEDSGDLAMMRSTYRNALIIEWFDSVGIYVNITVTYGFNWNIEGLGCSDFNTRKEATEQAIKKANEIYNENKITEKG